MKAITETNSGKLISLISSDLFTVERGLGHFPMLLASPFLNGFGIILLSQMIRPKFLGLVFVFWIVELMLQY